MQRFSDFELWLLGATQNSKPTPPIPAIEYCSHRRYPRPCCRRPIAVNISPYQMGVDIVDVSPWLGSRPCCVARFPMREQNRLYLLPGRASVPSREKLPFCRDK